MVDVHSAREVDDLVSVLVPVHNGEGTLVAAARSVLHQTHPHVELIMVDDGSSDDSWRRIEELAAQDPRVLPIRLASASGGPAVPRNVALAASSGAFLALLDQDDRWLPEKLETQLRYFSDRRVGLVYSDCELSTGGSQLEGVMRAHGYLPKGDVRRNVVAFSFVPACTAMWKREVYERVGHFSRELSSVDDRDYWVRVALAGYWFDYCPDRLAVLNVAGNRLSSDRVKHDELSVEMWRSYLLRNPCDELLVAKLEEAKWNLAVSRMRRARSESPQRRLVAWTAAFRVSPTRQTVAAMLVAAYSDSRLRQGLKRRFRDARRRAVSALRWG